MRKVSVAVTVTYSYPVDVPDDVVDIETYCDAEDPVYRNLARQLADKRLPFDGIITSIIDEETEEVLYDYE